MFDFLTKKNKKPLFLEKYEKRFSRKIPGNTALESLRFVVIDTETTGLNLTRAQLLSFGGIAATGMTLNLADSLEIVFRHPHVVVSETARIHGILKSHVERGMAPGPALRDILDFIKDSVLVGHHMDFDKKILEKTLQNSFPGSKIKNKMLDTASLALRLEHFNDGYIYKPEDYTLDALCDRYRIPLNDRHTAAGDAFMTGQLLLKLLSQCKTRKIGSLNELLKKPGF